MKLKWLIIILFFISPIVRSEENLFRITLLGTGTPVLSSQRFGNSTLVEVGKQRFVFDFGRGNSIRLQQLGIRLNTINAGFITHFHSDHISGLPDFFLTSWVLTSDKRNTPFVLYGPKGTKDFADKLETAYSNDKAIRMKDEKLSGDIFGFDAHDVEPGVVYDKEGVKIIAFNNHHSDLIKPSYGYAIKYQGKKIVISGDTTVYPSMLQNYSGTDVIIHEVAYIPDELLTQTPAFIAIKNHHITPEQVGRIFSQVKPKLAVYSHIVFHLPQDKILNDFQINQLLTESTRKTYQGPLLIGSDLTTIDLTNSNRPTVYFNK